MKNKISILALLISLAIMMCLSGCGKKEDKAELVLITDVGTVEDGSFNQGAWEGIKKYAEENGISYKYYQPKEAEKEAYLESIKIAEKNGAKLIVCPGYLPETAVYEAQKKYPKINFILLDGVPHKEGKSSADIRGNVMPIVFSEAQAGFLAGYAAVRDGYTNIGFMGGEAEESVVRFGYGYVQGADYAAIEMNKKIDIVYCYSNTYFESAEVESMASDWYESGTQVIFACGGAMGRSVMSAAEKDPENRKVIGVDVDQSKESDTVITSAMKMLKNAVYLGIKSYYEDSFRGGEISYMDAGTFGIGLPLDTSKFNKFTEADYDQIYNRLIDGKVVPYDSSVIGTTDDLDLVNVTVSYIPF